MSLDTLKNRIKDGELSGVFMLCGREEYTKDHYASLIRKTALDSPLPDFNYIRYDASAQSLAELEDAMFSLPYMWDRKVIEIINLDIYKLSESAAEGYAGIFSQIPEEISVLLVFRGDEYPKESKAPKKDDTAKKTKAGHRIFVSAVEKYGLLVDFASSPADKLVTWILRHFKAKGVSVDSEVPKELLNICGSDMYVLQGEIEKLCIACEGETVNPSHVRKYCCENAEYKYYDLADAMIRRDIITSKNIIESLELGKNEIGMALGYLAKQYADMMLVKTALDAGKSISQTASATKIPDWRVRKIASAVSGKKLSEIAFAASIIASADTKIKTYRGDPRRILELSVYRICAYGK